MDSNSEDPICDDAVGTSEKLMCVTDPDPLTQFELRIRQPGWVPDCLKVYGDETAEPPEVLFVEEFLKKANDNLKIPFVPPLIGEPDPKWVLGSRLHELKDGNELPRALWNAFNIWLYWLGVAARNCNASLYRLRRIHLQSEKNAWPMEPLPTDSKEEWTVGDAEYDWQSSVLALRDLIRNPKGLKNTVVDMTQVNSYIVSIRAIGDIPSHEIGASESSHISLSSAFSSYWDQDLTGLR